MFCWHSGLQKLVPIRISLTIDNYYWDLKRVLTKNLYLSLAIAAILVASPFAMGNVFADDKDDKGKHHDNDDKKRSADLAISGPACYSGTSYTVTVTNNGPNTAHKVVVTSTGNTVTPVGTFHGKLRSGQSESFTVSGPGTVTVSSNTPDPVLTNNSVTVSSCGTGGGAGGE
jgi:hypothetical protein